jgi:hypothetical protein
MASEHDHDVQSEMIFDHPILKATAAWREQKANHLKSIILYPLKG